MKPSQIAWLAGLVAFVCSALIGQADLLGEPWKHIVTVTSVIATAISAFMLQRPWDQPSYFIQQDGLVKRVDQQTFEQHAKAAAEFMPQPLPVQHAEPEEG